MSQIHVIRDSFNAGELSPLLGSRFAVEKVASGCRKLRNFIPHVHGPVFRRPGLEYMGATAGAGEKSTLRGFNFSTTTGFVLELHPEGLRVWQPGETPALVELTNEVALPYSAAECAEVQWAGVNDTLYLAHPNHAPRVLTRHPDDDWRLEVLEYDWPAMGDENVRDDKIAAPDVDELIDVPTEEWPEFDQAAGDFEFGITGSDGIPGTARLYRWVVGTGWDLVKTLNWGLTLPAVFNGNLGTDRIARIEYEGAEQGPGATAYVSHAGGIHALPLDVAQPVSLQTVEIPADTEWRVVLDIPDGATVPTGSVLAVQKMNGATPVNLKRLAPIPGQTGADARKWPGPIFAAATNVRLNWVGRAVEGGTMRVETIEYPVSADLTLAVSDTIGQGLTMTASEALFQAGHVGSYWQITHARTATHVHIVAAEPTIVAATSSVLRVSGRWDVFTYGIWAATLTLEKKVNGEWEVLRTWEGNKDRNVIATGDEPNDVEMRLKISAGTSEAAETAAVPRFVLEAADARVSGIVKITAVGALGAEGKATTATVNVIHPLHSTGATALWTEGAWSDVNGFPRSVAIHGQRLWFGGTAKEPQRIWGSGTADFLNYRRSSLDDASVSFTPAADPGNVIQWMIGHGKELIVGTAGNEFTLSSEGPIVTPTDVLIEPRSAYGSQYIQAEMLGDGIAFVQRGGRKLRQIAPRSDTEAWSAADLVVLAEHVAQSGIVQIAAMTHPFTILWAVAANGLLLGMTFEQEQNVFAWHVHETDGLFESVAVVRGVDADEVWFCVNRDGARSIERFDPLVFARDFSAPAQLMYLDAAKRATTGLEHLEGREVVIMADGAEHPASTVTGGAVTLEREATDVVVGLPFESRLQPSKIELPLRDGTAQGRKFRMNRVMLTLHESLGGEVADNESTRFEKLQYRTAANAMDAPPPLFTGDKETAVEARAQDGYNVTVKTSGPFPLNIGAVVIKGDIHGE